MFWIITLSVIWVVALAFVWLFIFQAGKINERFDRDAAAYIDRLLQHAESRGLEDILSDTKPAWLERELLTSRQKAAEALRRQDSGAVEGGQPSRHAGDER